MIVFIIIIHVWCVQLILIIFFFIFFFLQWNENESNEDNFQYDRRPRVCESTMDKKILWPFAIVDMCAQVLTLWFLHVHKAFSLWWKTDYSSLLIFLFLEVFIYCTYRLQNVWHSLHYDSIMPSNLYLVINTKFCGYIY